METALTDPLTAATYQQKKPLPGDLAMWMFIAAELLVFALLFLLFTVLRVSNADLFTAGQQTLHPEAGLINTLALLTASWLVVQAVTHNRHESPKKAALWMFAAILAASLYVVVEMLGSTGSWAAPVTTWTAMRFTPGTF